MQPKTEITDVTPPYSEYKRITGKPIEAEYFGLGNHWQVYEGEVGDELKVIQDYFQEKTGSGEMDNSVDAVKTKLKELERLVGVDKTERTVVKMAKIAAYVKFLKESSKIERDNKHYAT